MDWRTRAPLKTIAGILVVSLICSSMPSSCAAAASEADSQVEALAKAYPNARMCRISPEEFRQIEPLLREQAAEGNAAFVQLAQLNPASPSDGVIANPALTATNGVASNATCSVTNGVPGVATNQPAAEAHSLQTNRVFSGASAAVPAPYHANDGHGLDGLIDLFHDLGHSHGSDHDTAVVIFVVIGVVVVLAVVVYAGAFLYAVLTGVGNHSYWWDIEAQTGQLTGNGNSGSISGLKFSSGFRNEEVKVGLVLEGGYLDVKIRPEHESHRIEVSGAFAMAGAGVRWGLGELRINQSFFGVELLAGTGSDPDVGLMSTARANLSFGIGERTRIGLTAGTLYMGLTPKEGLLNNVDSFATLFGVQAGYRF